MPERIWSARWSGTRRTSRRATAWSIRSPRPASAWTSRRSDRRDARWTGDAGPGDPAIPARVLRQVLLVVILGVIEGRLVGDLGRDRAESLLPQRGLERLSRLLGRRALLLAGRVDPAAVLRARVVALAHPLRGIVALPEYSQQLR